jgi:hypothetical protein
MTVTLSIGLSDAAGVPLSPLDRERFVADVRRLLGRTADSVYVDNAASVGVWNGHTEQSRTWVAEVPDPHVVEAELPDLCRRYRQDAIALTVGTTELVSSLTGASV